ERGDVDMPRSITQPSRHDVAAGQPPKTLGYFRIVSPEHFACRRVIGRDDVPGLDIVERSPDHQRRGFHPARGRNVGVPGEAKITNVARVNDIKWAVALLGRAMAGRWPLRIGRLLRQILPDGRQRQQNDRGACCQYLDFTHYSSACTITRSSNRRVRTSSLVRS